MARIYLAQHGVALDASVDPTRPLSDDGQREVLKLAWAMQRAAVQPLRIYHSGKLRAEQTAELFARELGLSGAEQRPGMTPKADAAAFVRELDGNEAMYVGHLPHLERALGLMLSGSEQACPLAFRNAAVLCVAQDPDLWRLQWYLVPALC